MSEKPILMMSLNTDEIRADWPMDAMKAASEQIHTCCDALDGLTEERDNMLDGLRAYEAQVAQLEAELAAAVKHVRTLREALENVNGTLSTAAAHGSVTPASGCGGTSTR